jgi:hypothetical protein
VALGRARGAQLTRRGTAWSSVSMRCRRSSGADGRTLMRVVAG